MIEISKVENDYFWAQDGIIRLVQDGVFIYVSPDEYDQFVTELEEKARELWPEKFKPRTLESWHEEFSLVHRDDGSTDMVRKADRLNRERQIPINSRTR